MRSNNGREENLGNAQPFKSSLGGPTIAAGNL